MEPGHFDREDERQQSEQVHSDSAAMEPGHFDREDEVKTTVPAR